MTIHDWERLSDETLLRYKVFEVRKSRRRSPRTGADIGFFLIDTPDWVNVLALTPDEQLILIRQFRHGTERVSLEIPGGLIDPHETDPAMAAHRELREETGYEAAHLELLGVMSPNPSMMTNRCHAYLATGCRRIGELAMDPGEDIEVVTMPVTELDGLLRRGEIDHAIVLATIAFWRARGGGSTKC
jgi:8-oxo-dGTP pyrophosphatase MutT (NUDIX family)